MHQKLEILLENIWFKIKGGNGIDLNATSEFVDRVGAF
jgi:hypothetical protein